MDKITGRSDDMLIIRGVNVFPSQIEEHILKIDALAPHYQLVVTREERLDALKVQVELKAEHETLSREERAGLADNLKHAIKNYIGITTRVELLDVGAVPRSLGKAQRIVDQRPKEE
jgi:phenylacetate-CoA ligase